MSFSSGVDRRTKPRYISSLHIGELALSGPLICSVGDRGLAPLSAPASSSPSEIRARRPNCPNTRLRTARSFSGPNYPTSQNYPNRSRHVVSITTISSFFSSRTLSLPALQPSRDLADARLTRAMPVRDHETLLSYGFTLRPYYKTGAICEFT